MPNASDANKTAPTDIEKGNGRNNIMDSDIMMSGYGSNIILGNKDGGGKGEDIAIMKATNYFTDKYSNFLWFYNKVFNYLEIYNKRSLSSSEMISLPLPQPKTSITSSEISILSSFNL